MGGSRVAVVIPAYNEAATIGSIVAQVVKMMPVVVVDDCSEDDTAAVASAAGAHVVRNPTNLGYDQSLDSGVAVAIAQGHEYIITMDADGEHDPKDLPKFREALLRDAIPLVVGVRPRKQRFAEVLMCAYVRMRFGVHDILCGMKGYRTDLLPKGIMADRSSIGTHAAISAIRRGNRFRNVPIHVKARPGMPRFGIGWQANRRILIALLKLIQADWSEFTKRLFTSKSSHHPQRDWRR